LPPPSNPAATTSLTDLLDELAAQADPERARASAWFFKTGSGQYGEGDQFLGIRVPVTRKIAHRYLHLPLTDIRRLLHSPIHEHRFTAAEILVARYERASEPETERIFTFYLRNAKRFNNWDLVDTSCRQIVGAHLLARPRDPLYRLARSPNLWERRIAIVSTFAFTRHGQLDETFRIAYMLINDTHDLIQKAVGWALREAGLVSRTRLLTYLERHYSALPRTTLRYAIEHLPDRQRKRVLAGIFD
jgi:3-methyladenine DNA glycosylase AlkD